MVSDKNDLRRILLQTRRSITPALRASRDTLIRAQLWHWWTQHRVPTMGVYWPIRGEPDLHALYVELAAAGVCLALPVVVGNDLPLRFAAWVPGDTMVKDAFGVSVPAIPDFLPPPDALLIPCVGFNDARIRLGYGGGFYDRTLASAPRPYTIGVAYADARASFDGAAHDIALDIVMTESTILTAT